MKRFPHVAVVLVALLMVAAERPAAPSGDLQSVQGDWTVESVEPAPAAGQKTPVGDTVTIAQDTMKVNEKASGRTHEFQIKIDGAKSPKQVDWIMKAGDQTAVIPGIYSLDKDTIKICLTKPGMARPTDFAKTGEGQVVMVLKRAKKG